MLRISCVTVEQVYISLVCDRFKYIFGAVYIPPGSDRVLYEQHCETVELLSAGYPGFHFMLAGDYNLPGVRIVNNEFMDYRPNSPANLVFNTFPYVNLSQRNEIPNNNNVFFGLSIFKHCRPRNNEIDRSSDCD